MACEELGHHPVPGPIVESVAAVPALLSELGSRAELRSPVELGKWLPGLASGEILASMAAPPALPYAVDADLADLVLFAGAESVHLAAPAVPACVPHDPGAGLPQLDTSAMRAAPLGNRRLFPTGPGTQLASGPQAVEAIRWALDLGALACAAALLGAGRALVELSVTHARQRVQFGRPIGAFQAVKHQLAEAHIGLAFARPLLHAAAVAVAGRMPTAAQEVSAAKVACTDAAHRAAGAALQVHGAMGYAAEYDLGLWLANVRILRRAWGTPAWHRARVMNALTESP